MAISTTPVGGTQQVAAANSGAAITFTLPAPPTAGNVLFALFAGTTGGPTVTGIADNGGAGAVDWGVAPVASLINGKATLEIWMGVVGAGASATQNVTLSGSATTVRGNLAEWSGVSTSRTLLATASNSGTTVGASGANTISATISPTAGKNAVLLAVERYTQTAYTSGAGGGFTNLSDQSNFFKFSYRVESSTSGSYTPSWVYTAGTAADWGVLVIAAEATSTPALAMSVQPAASVASGGTLTATVSAPGAANGTAVSATLTNTLTGATTALAGSTTSGASASFTFAGVTGDGLYTIAFAATGYTGVSSSSVLIVGAVVAANQALVTAWGGDAALFSVHDPRLLPNGALTSWADSLGRAGITFAEASVPPVVAAGVLTFDGTQQMTSNATVASLALNSTTPGAGAAHVLVVYKATANGPVAGIAADPSAETYPWAVVQAAGGVHKADVAGTASTNRYQPTSGTATGSTVRAAIAGRHSHVGDNADCMWLYCLMGRDPQHLIRSTKPSSSTAKATLGRLTTSGGTARFTGEILWVGYAAVDLTAARLNAFWTFAQALGAAVDTSGGPDSGVTDGTSLTQGSKGSPAQPGVDPLDPAIGTGTTTYPVQVVPSLPGFDSDTADQHSYNVGVSGRTNATMLAQFDTHVGIHFDNTRSGKKLVFAFDIGNELQNNAASINGADVNSGTYTLATLLGKLSSYKSACAAVGAKLVVLTCPDRGGGATGGRYSPASAVNNSTGFYFDGTFAGRSRVGDMALAANAALVADAAHVYADLVVDLAADAAFAIGGGACLDATYYNRDPVGDGSNTGDRVHLTAAGYARIATLINAQTASIGALFTATGAARLLRRRRTAAAAVA